MTASAYVIKLGPSSEKRPTIRKDVDASLVYGIDIQDIIATGDTIASCTAAASGVTVGTASFLGNIISARVSAGTEGVTGSVTFEWTTDGGDTDQRTLWFQVEER